MPGRTKTGVAAALVVSGLLTVGPTAAAAPSHTTPDKAVLVGSTGFSPGTAIIDNTASASGWINAFYSPTDRLLAAYVDAGSTVTLTWHVTGSNGQVLPNTDVTLGSNLAYSNSHGTLWNQTSLNTNPNGAQRQTTDAQGNVTFTLVNTNTSSGSRPTDLTSAAAAEAAEVNYPWSRFTLTVGSDIFTANPNPPVNQATDMVDLIVIPRTPVLGTKTSTTTIGNKTYTYGATNVVLSASTRSANSGTMTFTAGGQTLCSVVMTSASATCPLSGTQFDVGSYPVTATFSGSNLLAPSSGVATITVNRASSTLVVTPSATTVAQSSLGNLSFAVSLGSRSGPTPPGTVSLNLDGQQIAPNVATFSFASMDPASVSVGRHVVTLTYPGNTDFRPVSWSKTITVSAPTTPLSVSLPSTSTNYDLTHGPLLWSETFPGSKNAGLDSSIWSAEVGQWVGRAPGLPDWPYGTGEIETNTSAPANVSSDGLGNLVLTALATSSGGWTSARISTAGKVNFQYGQLEANIKLPAGTFNWPAFWMLGQNFFTGTSWPNCGEIDIMEGLSNNSVGQSTLHANYPGGGDWNGGGGVTMVAPLANISSSFHTFGMIWTPTSISFLLDGRVYGSDVYNASAGTVTQTIGSSQTTFTIGGQVWPFTQPFFLILDNAIPAGTSAPAGTAGAMQVNWIKYYGYQGLGRIS